MVKEFLIAQYLIKILGKNMWSCREKFLFSKTLKIFWLAQKLREEEYFKVNTSDPYKSQQKTSKNVAEEGHPLKTTSLMKILKSPLALLTGGSKILAFIWESYLEVLNKQVLDSTLSAFWVVGFPLDENLNCLLQSSN